MSFDDGEHWQPFKNGLPDTPVTDIWVEDNALAIATHGRSFYVMDNLATLRQFGAAPLDRRARCSRRRRPSAASIARRSTTT